MRPETVEARRRIIDAGIRSLIAQGVEGATMGAIADAAGVSKALVHYHFVDRASLFGEIATRLGQRITAREAHALSDGKALHVVDALRAWLLDEHERGEVRALIGLGLLNDPTIALAVTRTQELRRRSTTLVVARVFERLSLAPRLPSPLIADAAIALVNGLVLQDRSESLQASFDGFWLAMLNLTES